MSEEISNGNGRLSLVLGLVTIGVTVGGSFWILWNQINSQREYFETKTAIIETELKEHEGKDTHVGTAKELSAIKVQFIEVETQFRWLREVTDLKDAEQQARIKELSEQVRYLEEELKSK